MPKSLSQWLWIVCRWRRCQHGPHRCTHLIQEVSYFTLVFPKIRSLWPVRLSNWEFLGSNLWMTRVLPKWRNIVHLPRLLLWSRNTPQGVDLGGDGSFSQRNKTLKGLGQVNIVNCFWYGVKSVERRYINKIDEIQ